MLDLVLALPRRALGLARVAVNAAEGIPRIADALEELRDAVKHVERLATFAAEELPEVVYQLEAVREQLDSIEQRLTATSPAKNGKSSTKKKAAAVTPASRRNG
ncbi:hypothetical protein [Amycolatopsis nigrescens]|uniref:hypothetical protein n=1 Tax=Amycolatopsis nigrescens TaxID=381445 RepID=UPI000364B8CB|nr:hypothetical protein [Amycolatopsis nigrescens]